MRWRFTGTLEHCFTSGEREMLIRYCTRYTHDWSLAEDLTQQALLEAWLKSERLYSHEVRASWLIGIAHNVCLRWVRRQSQEKTHVVWVSDELDALSEMPALIENDVDLTRDIERHELALLLEKATALLSPQTRIALTQHYLEGIPQAEVAARLGITVGAVEARLHRGKQALRHLLTHELREEASSYGLITSVMAKWQHTHIWCPICGQQHLLIKWSTSPGTISFRCPACSENPGDAGWSYPLSNAHFVQLLAGLTQPKSVLRRFSSWAYDYYFTAASHCGLVACAQCGQQRRLHLTLPTDFSEVARDSASRYGLHGQCPSCGWQDFCSPAGLLYSLPDVQRFWQTHSRMRLVFREPIEEVSGQRAVFASFESVTDSAHLDIVLAQETLNLIDVHMNAH